MKLLLLSDKESPYLWDYYQPGRLSGYDLMLSCGDLNPKYLSFLVTMGRARLLYVHGNHDTGYERTPPEGCECIEDKSHYQRHGNYRNIYGRRGTANLGWWQEFYQKK